MSPASEAHRRSSQICSCVTASVGTGVGRITREGWLRKLSALLLLLPLALALALALVLALVLTLSLGLWLRRCTTH